MMNSGLRHRHISTTHKIFVALGIFILAITLLLPIHASASTIKAVKPDALDKFMNRHVMRFFIDGVINERTLKQVKQSMNNYPGQPFVYLNSPGGNLIAALKIGRILREHSAVVFVGEYEYTGKQRTGPRIYKINPGRCLSACTFIFLGGEFRFMYSDQSKLGVHQFWSTTGPQANDLSRGQIITTAIANYLDEMHIDADLLNYMVSAGKNEMRYLDSQTMARLNVTNDGRALPKWSFILKEGVTFLYGSQNIMAGDGFIAMGCQQGNVVMLTRAEVGVKNARMIINERFTPYFMVKKIGALAPDTAIKITPTVFEKYGRFIDTTFVLSYQLGQNLDVLDAFGIGFVVPDNSGRFIGFVIDIGNDKNRKRITQFLSSCE